MLNQDTQENENTLSDEEEIIDAPSEVLKSDADSEPKENVKMVEISETDWEKIQIKLKEGEESTLRLTADFDNMKKRLNKRTEELVKYANEKIVEELLLVIDDFDRALGSLDEGHDLQTIKDGMHMVQKTFHKILEQNGVAAIDTTGKVFDPNFHEAVGEVVDNDQEEDAVASEVQRGYTLNGRLVRPSRVQIIKHSE
ncbi:MAG: molecular chaperone GrpE [Candidatus Omnitrophota bacterium]|jgi:molecular chaperone GrpE